MKRPRHTYEASGSTLLIVAMITIPQSSGGWAVASNREVLQITASGWGFLIAIARAIINCILT